MIDYDVLKDEQLLQLIQQDDKLAQETIIKRYKNLVSKKSRQYFIMGADKEDIIQEGMLGLFKAIRDFDVKKNVSFYPFAELCITRQIITAIKTATRQKHIPLNSYVSLNKNLYDNDGDSTIIDTIITDKISNPEDLFIGKEGKVYIQNRIQSLLSNLEYKVLMLYLQGNSYLKIANILRKDEKSIDNTIQRIRKKIKKQKLSSI